MVTEIRRTAKGVRIGYTQGDRTKALEADYCFCALPMTLLKKIPNDFSAPYKQVIEASNYAAAYKIAWESRRFWEQDYNIYGGLESVNTGCSPVWFPSGGMFSDRGIVVSGYAMDGFGPFGSMTMEQKFAESRRTIERLHPGHGKELEKPMYVNWGRIAFNEGSWVQSYGADEPARGWGDDAHRVNAGYETLIQPDGPIYFVGDHVSQIVGWQEGAAVSALRAVQLLSDRVRRQKSS